VRVATSTIRFAIIVALVVVGAVVIAQFPQGTASAPGGTPTPTVSVTTPAGGGGQGNGGNTNTGGGTQEPTASLAGVKVAVYNGTTQTGLAADVATALVKKFDVKIDSAWILNAPSGTVDLTAIYFVSAADKVAASDLADSYFKKLQTPPKVQKLPDNTTVPAGVQVAVYLGIDYVNA
jgi:hypothetical protein